jgi:hypothetical protein
MVALASGMSSPVSAEDSRPIQSELLSGTSLTGSPADPFGAVDIIGMDELDNLRGGFEIGGLQISIGANIRTLIDGIQVLESMVNLIGTDITAGGQSSTSTVQNSVEFPGLQIVDTGGLDALRDQIPDQVDLGAFNGANGVILNDSKGFTAALHQINRSQIISALVNTANGRLLRQEVDVIVDIANFRQFQEMARNALKAGALARAGSLK